MYYAKGIIPLTKIFGRGLHSQEPKGGFAVISHLITLNKMVQLTEDFRTELGGCLYLQANAFCHLCRLNTPHADRTVAGWPQGLLERSHMERRRARDDARRGRVPAPATSRRQGNSPGTLCGYQTLDPAAPECQCSRCHHTHPDTRTQEPTNTASREL